MTSRRVSYLSIAFVFGVMVAAPLLWGWSPWTVRCATLVAVILSLRAVAHGPGRHAAGSPLLLLPLLIIVFYSLAGAAEVEIRASALPFDNAEAFVADYQRRVAQFDIALPEVIQHAYATRTELLVLEFSLALLLALCLLVQCNPARSIPSRRPAQFWAVAVITVGVMVIGFLTRSKSGDVLDQVKFGTVVAACWCLAQFAVWWSQGERWSSVAFIVSALAFASVLPPGVLKPLALTFLACVLYVSVLRPFSWRQLTLVICLVGLCAGAGLAYMGAMRNAIAVGSLPGDPLWVPVYKFTRSKVIYRQAETMYCLASVASHAEVAATSLDPGYFFGILVPRVVDPEKPNYSNGADYAVRYCLTPAGQNTGHSASITLLGEGFLHGGWPMAIAVASAVVAILAGLSWWRLLAPQSVIPLALSSWFADFDQAASLWLGGGAKALLVLMVLSAAMAWFCRAFDKSSR